MFPQFNCAQHFVIYCNYGNLMLLRFAAVQRCDLDTWRTLTLSLCETVNCVCSQTHCQTQTGLSRPKTSSVVRTVKCAVGGRCRREEQNPPNKVGVESITLCPPVSFLIQTHLTGFFHLLLSFISLAAF